MRIIKTACVVRAWLALLLIVGLGASSGCTELYLLFGPGGPIGPSSGGSTSSASTQPAAIPGPIFSARQIDPLLEATAGARVIVVADINGDGLNDFVSGSAENEPIQLHLRTSAIDASYSTITIAGGAPIATMYDLEVADFDADGNPDVAVLVNDTGFIPVAGADRRGAIVMLFAPADPSDALSWQSVTVTDTFFLPGDEEGLTDFGVAEIDGVNGPDIVVGSNETSDHAVYLYRNPGAANSRNGALWARSTVNLDGPPFKRLELADIDGDTDIDVVATFPIAKSFNVRWLINPLIESGVGAVSAAQWTIRNIGEQRVLTQPGDEQNPGADFISVGDIDGDGDLDVASVHQSEGLIQWFEHPGTATVALQTFGWNVYNLGTVASSASINQLQLVDLNMDGRMDAFVTASGNMVGFQPGLLTQAFWTPFSIVGTNPVATIGRCAFDDVDGNGLLDIIAPMDRSGLTNDQFLILFRLTP
jgi:hypothetical protein